jgi:hypothetical protein
MTVWVEQFDKGRRNGVPVMVTAKDGADDLVLLRRKAASHEANGWAVTWGDAQFIAKKQRHGGTCRRRFWVE